MRKRPNLKLAGLKPSNLKQAGFTLIEISQELEEKGIIRDSKAFLTYVNRDAKDELIGKFPFLSEVPGTILEGYLFPETYVLAKRSPYKKVVAAFLTQFQKQALPLYRAADTPLSLHETMTLASIVEKESFGHKEMRKISGVFHNRLKQRMLLASCPTVAYALGDPRKRTLSYKDLEVKSPYNTYRNRGLPPTPIAASGTLAIKAALYPVETPYLYFIANGDGTHTFTKTLAEHLKRQRVLMGH